MRKQSIVIVCMALALCAVGAVGVAHAQTSTHPTAQAGGEHIEHFDVTAHVHADATVAVVETIAYAFGGAQRHGIFRDIPVRYATTLGQQSIALSNISVVDQNGTPQSFTISYPGSNEELKIGDANTLVTGNKTYIISYTVSRSVGYFADYDEWYWNVTGNGWQVPIDEASAEVFLPQAVAPLDARVACYQGPAGSNEQCATTQGSASIDKVLFAASRPLARGEGLTVAVGFPKGIVEQPSVWAGVLQAFLDNSILALPFIIFIAMFVRWYNKGRDPRGRGTIIPEYDAPDNLTPIECATVLHSRVHDAAISAELISLATRGYLTITRSDEKVLLFTHTDYVLNRLTPSGGEALSTFDQLLLDALFVDGATERKLSDLKNNFYTQLPAIKTATLSALVTKGYFPENPTAVVGAYLTMGILCIVAGFSVAYLFGALWCISLIVSGSIVVAFGYLMPRVTQQGAVAREHIKGLALYLDVAEKSRIAFHNAPEKNPALFEKLLPYAMVLGVEEQWAKQFEGIYTTPPSWYHDPHGGAFNAIILADSLHTFSTSASSTLAAAPSGGSGSMGGGFSGGGFGGGGGGSW